MGDCLNYITGNHPLPFSLFLMGLAGGVTHCAGMCTPFVLSQINGDMKLNRVQNLLLPYHLGRMTTYVILGVLLHSVLNLAFLFSNVKPLVIAPLLLTAAIIFLVSVFPALSSLFPWVSKLKVGIPGRLLDIPIAKLMSVSNPMGQYGLGVLLGFMPCGLVVGAILASATAPSSLQAALSMAAFSAGTMPALVIIGLIGSGVRFKFPHTATYLTKTAMMISSLWLFTLAGMMILERGQ